MKFTSLTIALVYFLFLPDVQAQTINYPQNIEWNKAGAVTAFPDIREFDRIFHIPSHSTDNDWQLIQSAIDSAGASPGTNLVLLSEGTFLLDRPLVLEAGTHDNVYIKGAGPNHLMHSGPTTILEFDFTDPENFIVPVYGGINAGIAFKGGYDVTIGKITEFDSANNQITIAEPVNDLSPGDIIRVRSNSGNGCKGYPCMGQINRIESVISHSPLVFELEHDFSLSWEHQNEYGGLNLYVHKMHALQNVGISSLGLESTGFDQGQLPNHFDCKDQPAAQISPQAHHILAFRVYNAHIQDLYSYKPIASHVYMLESLNNTVSENFFNDVMFSHGCNGGHGYGVNLWRKNTLNLVENNIFRHLRRALAVSRGAHKNVIGYNYSREVWRQTGNPQQGADFGNRNWNSSGNLVEGNRISRIWNDMYHEKNYIAYKEVYVRNFTTLHSMENEGGIEIYFIGNQGAFTGGNNPSSIITDVYGFIDSASSTHGNFSTGYSDPDYLLTTTSLYHQVAPEFIYQQDNWNQQYSWPLIGPRLNLGDPLLTQDIPARGRYCAAYYNYPDSAYHCSGLPGFLSAETDAVDGD